MSRRWRRVREFSKQQQVPGTVIGGLLVVVILAAVGPTRRGGVWLIRMIGSWLDHDAGAAHWALVLMGAGCLITGFVLALLLPIRSAIKLHEDAELQEARRFRDEFLDLMQWLLSMRYDFREGHNDPNDPAYEAEYEDKRSRLIELHDRVGPRLRSWLDNDAEARYDIARQEHAAAQNFYSSVHVLEEPADAPYTRFFEPSSWDPAMDAAQSLGQSWSDGAFEREIRRRKEALDAHIRWLQQHRGGTV